MGASIDALPYIDTLIKEYLLFRGFTATLSAFNLDLSSDPGCGFQAERITDMIFRQLIPSLDCQQLVEFLEYLNMQLYSRLDSRYEPLVSAVEADLLRLFLVTAHNANRSDKMFDFFRLYGPQLISSSSSSNGQQSPVGGLEWKEWFLLPYLQNPENESRFQLYFSSEWASLLETSFYNFMSGVVRSLPMPAILRFNTDRRLRLTLQQQVHALQAELDVSKQQLAQVLQAAQLGAQAAQAMPGRESPQTQQQQVLEHQQLATKHLPARTAALQPLSDSSISVQPAQQQQQWQQGNLPSVATQPVGASMMQQREDPTLVDWQHKLRKAPHSSGGASGTSLHDGCPSLPPAATQSKGSNSATSAVAPQEQYSDSQQTGAGLFELLPQSSGATAAASSPGQSHSLQQQVFTRHTRNASFGGSITFDAAPLLGADGHNEEGASSDNLEPRSVGLPHTSSPHQADQLGPYMPVPHVLGAAACEPPNEWLGPRPSMSSNTAKLSSNVNKGTSRATLSSSPLLSWAGTSTGRPQHIAAAAGGIAGSSVSASGVGGLDEAFNNPLPVQVPTVAPLGHHAVVTCQRYRGATSDAVLSEDNPTADVFSPSGCNVASFEGGSSSVHIWSPAGLHSNTARDAVVTCGVPVTCIAWDSRADKLMLIGCAAGGGVRAWHADTRRIMDTISSEPGFPVVAAVVACPAEPTFVVAANSQSLGTPSFSSDRLFGRLVTYNARSFKRSSVLVLPDDTGVASMCYNSTGSQLLVGTTVGTALVYEPSARSSPLRLWRVAAATARSQGASQMPSSHVQVLWRPSCARGSNSSVSGVTGAGAGDGSMLTLSGGVLCEWVLTSIDQLPVMALDVLTAAQNAVSSDLQNQGLGLNVVTADNPWSSCATVSPDGSNVAVLCCCKDVGVLLLVCLPPPTDGTGFVAEVLLQGSMLAGKAGAISWHPTQQVVVVSGRGGSSFMVSTNMEAT